MSYVIVNLSHCSYYNQPRSADDFMMISLRQLITDKHLHWGFPKCFCRIRKLGYKWNHKRLGLLSIKTQYSLNEINDYPNVFQNHYQITWSKHRLH